MANYSVTSSDSISISAGGNGNTNYSVTSSDSISISAGDSFTYDFLLSDNILMSDGVISNYSVLATDNITISDNNNLIYSVLASDNLSMSGGVTADFSYNVLIEEKVAMSDDENYNFSYIVSSPDILVFTDSTSKDYTGALFINDDTIFSDVPTYYVVSHKSISDNLLIKDQPYFYDSYVKKTGDHIQTIDNTNSRLDAKVRMNSLYNFSIQTVGYVFSTHFTPDGFLITDICNGGVIWDTIVAEPSVFVFSDSSNIIVTRTTETTYTNSLLSSVGVSETTLYTCTYDNASIINISLANISSSNIIVDVLLYKGGAGIGLKVMKNIDIGVGETFVINKNENCITTMENADELRVISTVASSLDVYTAIVQQQTII